MEFGELVGTDLYRGSLYERDEGELRDEEEGSQEDRIGDPMMVTARAIQMTAETRAVRIRSGISAGWRAGAIRALVSFQAIGRSPGAVAAESQDARSYAYDAPFRKTYRNGPRYSRRNWKCSRASAGVPSGYIRPAVIQ